MVVGGSGRPMCDVGRLFLFLAWNHHHHIQQGLLAAAAPWGFDEWAREIPYVLLKKGMSIIEWGAGAGGST